MAEQVSVAALVAMQEAEFIVTLEAMGYEKMGFAATRALGRSLGISEEELDEEERHAESHPPSMTADLGELRLHIGFDSGLYEADPVFSGYVDAATTWVRGSTYRIPRDEDELFEIVFDWASPNRPTTLALAAWMMQAALEMEAGNEH